MNSLKSVFMGTSIFAVPVLEALLGSEYRPSHVITQPDRRAGRGRKLSSPPVKTLALENDIPVYQPENVRKRAVCDTVASWDPDIIITASYGQLLSRRFLKIPEKGVLNVHASLLPELRGAAPIHHAILLGLNRTGVSIMKTDIGMDSGPVLSQIAVPVAADETTGSLSQKLSEVGAKLLLKTIPGYLSGNIKPIPQDHEKATYAPKISAQDALIDWTLPAETLDRLIRALNPAPVAFTFIGNRRLKIFAAGVQVEGKGISRAISGTVLGAGPDEGVLVQTGQGILNCRIVQPESKGRMTGKQLLTGRYVDNGTVFTGPEELN